MRLFKSVVCGVVCVWIVMVALYVADAQTTTASAKADAPAITEVEALKLEAKFLALQNTQLRIEQTCAAVPAVRALQEDIARLETDLNGFAKTLEKPGFVLQRTTDGQWRRVAAPKADAAPGAPPRTP